MKPHTKSKNQLIILSVIFSAIFVYPQSLFASDYDFNDESEFSIYEEPTFVTESGDAFSSMQDGFEVIESNPVDIVLPNANRAAIQDLDKGMKELSPEERLNYVREHGEEYKDKGAVTVFAGENIGEVVVNGSIQYDAPVEYQPLGKAELGHATLLQGALLELTKYPENANIKEATLPALTYKFFDDKSMTTAQRIVPGVLATCVHGPDAQPNQTINLGYVSIGEKDDFTHVDKQFVVDRVMQGEAGKNLETDARLISLRTPDILESYLYNPIPVMPLEDSPPHKGDKTKMFLRKNEDGFGIKYPERFSEAAVTIDFNGFLGEPYGDHWADHRVMNGHSGTFEYKVDNNGNVNLLGPVVRGLKFANPSSFGMFVNPKFVTGLRDQLADEYQRNAQGGLTQSEKDFLMKKTSDELSRAYETRLKRDWKESGKDVPELIPG